MAGQHKRSIPQQLPPLRLAFLLTLLLASFTLLPRVHANPWLAGSCLAAAGVLFLFQFVLRRHVTRTRRTLRYEFAVPSSVHYVQATMQLCIYAYWGWYWREVYHYMPLIGVQLVFAYVLDMLVCWARRDTWVLGFGPWPIILSTNLFLWFKDDWFFLQFVLVSTGVLGKEFFKWTREGRLTHIFNPSAFSSFVFSVALIATNSTHLTWGDEIASTMVRPPNIYLEIFLVGLVVQALYSVTLVTLAAVAALYVLNLVYTSWTGVYHYIDSNIPVAVFLGMHLLVTDPATSPRTALGKMAFGGMYGASVFGLYPLLGWFGIPRFYDKLLCVPLLNLSVRALDRASNALAARCRALVAVWSWSPRQLNLAHMAVWIALFGTMMATNFLGKNHPGRDTAFWQRACDEGRLNGCQTWVRALDRTCSRHSAVACDTLGQVLNEGHVVPRAPLAAGLSFGHACDLGLPSGCTSLKEFMRADGQDVFLQACDRGDGASCFLLGSLYYTGIGVPQDVTRAVTLFHQSCTGGSARGCSRLGASYVKGEGTAVNYAKAIESFEKACRGEHAASCSNVAIMYRRGIGGRQDEALARQRFAQACDLGLQSACQGGKSPAVVSPAVDPEASGRGGTAAASHRF